MRQLYEFQCDRIEDNWRSDSQTVYNVSMSRSKTSPAALALLASVLCSNLGCARTPTDAETSNTSSPSAASPSASASPSAAPAVSRPAPTTSTPKPPASNRPMTMVTKGGPVPAAQAKRVLHVGDSMVPLVGNYLRQVFRKDKRRYEIVSIPSSSTLSWAREHRLRDAMFRYDPQVVIISLGSNELFDPNPERRASSIRQIVSETRDRPCLWIGPPAWKQDKGFLRVLKENVGRCRYFDSAKLELDRMADGRHPSWTGSYKWASEVWKVLGGTQPIPAGNVKPRSQ